MATIEQLGTYLTDHLGGANAGLEMARRLQSQAQGEPDAEILGRLAEEIEQDVETLRALAEVVGSGSHPVKEVAGRVAGKVHGLAAAETRTGSPHLSRLLEAESLAVGVEGKLCLWLALIEVAPGYPQLAGVDLRGLADRARDQRRRLEQVRMNAARRAFAATDEQVP